MKYIRNKFSQKVTITVLIVFIVSILISIPNAFFYTLNFLSHSPDENTNVSEVLGVTDSSPIDNFPQTNGEVYTLALSGDGNTLYIGGSFSSVTDSIDTYTRNNLAAIDLNTLTVTSWDPNADNTVYTIEVSGSDIFVGGAFTSVGHVGGGYRVQFAKLNDTTGEADSNCYPYVYYYDDDGCPYCQTVYSIEVYDGYIYVGGHFDRVAYDGVGLDYRNNLLRFNNDATCSLDSWNPDPNGTVYSIEISGENLFIGGGFSTVGDESRSEFAKLSSVDGSVDASCNPNLWTNGNEGTYTVYSINTNNDYIYVGGSFDSVGGSEGTIRNEIARLNNDSTCTLDEWNPNMSHFAAPIVRSIQILESDVFVGGMFDGVGEETRSALALIDSSTGIVGTWNPNIIYDGEGWPVVYDMIFSNNYLIVGGTFTSVGEAAVVNLAAFPYETPVSVQDSLITSPTSSSTGPEIIQIPEMTTNLQGPVVINPVKESNTGGQEVVAVVFPGVFNFDAYFSANKIESKSIALSLLSTPVGGTSGTPTPKPATNNTVFAGGGDLTILGFKKGGVVSWQVSNIQEMWLKAYPAPGHDAAKIIPELQEKSSIIALKYKKSDLVPPGFPNTKFNELKLKIAHSLDGKTWTILPTSVVDPITNTVAAIGKIGGYYMIVGGY